MGHLVYTALLLTEKSKKKFKETFPGVHLKNGGKFYGEHVTLEFKPKRVPDIIGEMFYIDIDGNYFVDEKGEAVKVKLPNGIKSKNKNPHITISCANTIKPFYSNELIENGKAKDIGKLKLEVIASAYFGGKGHITDHDEASDLFLK
jgi:hypothetical protein